MDNRDLKPDAAAYSSMIQALCHLGRSLKADSIFMKAIPDAATCNILLDALRKNRAISLAYGVFCEMGHNGIKPSTATYNTLINGHCLLGEKNKANFLFDHMVCAGCPPDTMSYKTLVNGYRKCKRLDEAWNLVDKMMGKPFLLDAMRCSKTLVL